MFSCESHNFNLLRMLGYCTLASTYENTALLLPHVKFCDSVVFLLSENYFYPLHQAYNIMQCLQSSHKFIVAAAPHHHKHQVVYLNINILYLNIKVWKKKKNKATGTNDNKPCHTTSPPPKIDPDMQIKKPVVWQNDIFSMDGY